MEIYDITKLELVIRNESLNGKSKEEVKMYIKDNIVPVLFTHLTTKPKPGSASVSCTGSSGGDVSCTGSVSVSW